MCRDLQPKKCLSQDLNVDGTSPTSFQSSWCVLRAGLARIFVMWPKEMDHQLVHQTSLPILAVEWSFLPGDLCIIAIFAHHKFPISVLQLVYLSAVTTQLLGSAFLLWFGVRVLYLLLVLHMLTCSMHFLKTLYFFCSHSKLVVVFFSDLWKNFRVPPLFILPPVTSSITIALYFF